METPTSTATVPLTMWAVRVDHFGPPEAVTVERVDVPKPGKSEVLVQVRAAGVGDWDALVRGGKSGLGQKPPLTLGAELSGICLRLGDGVENLAIGDEVFGVTNAGFIGAQGEYAVAEAARLALKPASLDHVEAASTPVVAVTALRMLAEAGVARGQTVFVHGAAGNVGRYAVQLALAQGLRVLASARSAGRDSVLAMGASQVADIEADGTDALAGKADAVLDTVGGAGQAGLFRLVKPGGMLVSIVSPPDADLAAAHGVRGRFFIVDVGRGQLEALARMFDEGSLRTHAIERLPLAQARRAHEMLAGVRPRGGGKIVFDMDLG